MPTRRSSRYRTAAFVAPADGVTAAAPDLAAAAAPLSRRAARQRLAADVAGRAAAEAESIVVETVDPATADAGRATEMSAEAVAPEAEAIVAEAEAVAADAEAIVSEAVGPEAAEPEVVEPESLAEPDATRTAADPSVDPFVQASLAFRAVSGGEKAAPEATADAPAEEPAAASAEPVDGHIAPRRPKLRRFVTMGATVGVMSLAGLLAVSMTMPAEAVAAGGSAGTAGMSLVAASAVAGEDDERIQAFVTSSDVQNDSLARAEDFSTVSLVDLASEQGIKFSDSVFTNDPDAAIQWPFLVGVSMSSGYGPRWGTMHEGIDFTPGEGAPIQAIADGTVRIATEQGGGYGVTVYIDHVIDGQVVTSHYAHMQYGSLRVKAGDTVEVGDIVGLTGNTGHSFGAHLHFEIIINGSTIDPLPWLRANAGRYSLD